MTVSATRDTINRLRAHLAIEMHTANSPWSHTEIAFRLAWLDALEASLA